MGCQNSKKKPGAEEEENQGDDWESKVKHRELKEPSLKKVDNELAKDTRRPVDSKNAREESDI